MSAGLAEAIRAVVRDKGIPEELIVKVIEEFLLAAYKRKFGIDDNAVVQFSDDDEVTLYAQKRIVGEVEDAVSEITLADAQKLNGDAEIGDQLLIEIDPKEFDRVSIQSAKQKAKQRIREIQKDSLYSEFIDKVGELVIGYVQRERNGNIFIDLGKSEGILPKRYQSPREAYRANDRIKALIVDVEKAPSGLQIALSRTHTDLIKKIFALEVPEIYARTVEIVRIVREAGYRTKIAVHSHRDDVDPVGACVGLRGVRIQAIVRELEGEKIDVLKFDPDPRILIRNALSPADVVNVVILDETRRQALAIVPEDQLSLAIGKQGLNVRLANRLADWSIDVKTMEQFEAMDIAVESKRAVTALFSEPLPTEQEITRVSELPGVADAVVEVLERYDLRMIEDVVGMRLDDLMELDGMTEAMAEGLLAILKNNVEVVEQEPSEDEEEDYDRAVEEEEDEVVTTIAELPNMTESIVTKLTAAGIVELDTLISMTPKQIDAVEGLSPDEVTTVMKILTESVEIVEPDDEV